MTEKKISNIVRTMSGNPTTLVVGVVSIIKKQKNE